MSALSSASVAVSATVRTMKPPTRLRDERVLDLLAQDLALGLVLDALRDADVRVLRQVDEEPAGDRDLRGQARALGADGVLHDLHQQRLPLGEDLLDGRLAALAVWRATQMSATCRKAARGEADLDERRLHAGQHAAHAAEVDVADDAAVESRSMCSSCTAPCSVTATRVSCGVTLMRISSVMGGEAYRNPRQTAGRGGLRRAPSPRRRDRASEPRRNSRSRLAVSNSGRPITPV